MTNNRFSNKYFFIGLVFVLFCSISCKNNSTSEQINQSETIDSSQSNFIKVDKAVFSIPSPYQTSILFKSLGIEYNKNFCNTNTNLAVYSTNFKKALNLGVYGADLGYVSIYDQNQEAINYLKSAQKLASDIGIVGAFDKKLIERFQAALGKKDSMLAISSLAFRAANNYLQNNERNDIAALVIAGGFIETMYLTVTLANQYKTLELYNRVGEHKSSLDNLIKLLTPYYEKPEYTELVDQLIDLAYIFDAIEFKYSYAPPTTYEDKKLTVINGKTEVIITPEQIVEITKKITNIRNQIIS
jgi:hypothetical protein